ncbi:MAG: DUF1861 family protein [Clostridia bacterium]|nr:DUF1861 family protein [Clostridia bacterium]
MLNLLTKPHTCQELLYTYKAQGHCSRGEKLVFQGIGRRDVYNITAPFEDEGDMVIAGRVEDRNTQYSDIMFFICRDNVWEPRTDTISFRLQDPFYTRIHGELIIGGVEVRVYEKEPDKLCWRTLLYRGKSINELKHFASGPDWMKDIRLIQLEDGRIGVFTRPMGKVGGRGKIGFTIINTLDELNADVISNAELLNNQFVNEEWGGANELHILNNGLIGVLGHIACYDEKRNRHYYSIAFSLNPETREASPLKIIAVRSDFKAGDAKSSDLVDVIFSGGIVRKGNGKAVLYVGVSDAEAHRIVISDPFVEYER